jgi:hypothetical protein
MRSAHTLIALTLVAVAFGLAGLVVTGHEGHQGTPSPAAPECVLSSPPARTSTPDVQESPVSSPDAMASVARLGTPVSQSCLTVTLTADKTAAGPRTLIVTVVDASGAPVTDAGVTINTRHIGMDHGTSTAQVLATGPGHYAVEQVSMGMAGEWEAEIVISRPGQAPVSLIFVVDLEGPAH